MVAYVLCSVLGLIAAFVVSRAVGMPKPGKRQCFDIYLVAAIGAILGAKIPVWGSYGFSAELILSGKSYMGGVLGAFVAMNVYKYFSAQRQAAFGGRFVIPLAVAVGFGKIGCYLNGCCGGHFFMPVQLFESAFQFTAAFTLYLFYRRTGRDDLLFPIYLLAYLLMRFGIEFVRTEPRLFWGLTIYQMMGIVFIPVVTALLYQRRSRHA